MEMESRLYCKEHIEAGKTAKSVLVSNFGHPVDCTEVG